MQTHTTEASELFATDVIRLADALGWDRFSLLSHTAEAAIASQLVAAHAGDRVAIVCPLEAHHPHLSDPSAIEKAVSEELIFEDEEEYTKAHPAPQALSVWADVYFALCPKDRHLHEPIESDEYHDVWFARSMSQFEVL